MKIAVPVEFIPSLSLSPPVNRLIYPAALVALIAIGGYDATMRLIAYCDLQVRYFFIRLKMYFIQKRMLKQLLKDREQLLRDSNNG